MSAGPRGDGEHAAIDHHVLDEDLFKGILTRERRRADRSSQPLLLLVLEPREQQQGGAPLEILKGAIGALAATTRATDITGWLDDRTLIGVILPDIRAADLSSVGEGIEARLRRELSRRVQDELLGALSIRVHPYPEPRRAGAGAQWPVDSRLHPDLVPPRKRWASYDRFKRGLDIVGSAALLVALAPVFLAIAVIVKTGSRGPVVYRQVRVGRMTEPFTMLKFRTMYSNADHKVHQDYVSSFIKADGQAHDAAANGVFKITNDPRITPVGHFLRRTSLDELPQLWNVLRGDMSLVGPRPPVPYEVEHYEAWHRRRLLEAMPGVTGLWQVAGRSRTTFDEMVRLDLRYARTRSLWTDLRILAATPAAVVLGKGAC